MKVIMCSLFWDSVEGVLVNTVQQHNKLYIPKKNIYEAEVKSLHFKQELKITLLMIVEFNAGLLY